MKTRIHSNQGSFSVDIIGSLDRSQAGSFEANIDNLLCQHPSEVAFRMKRLLYIDASGIGAIIRCMNHAEREHVPLMFVGLTDNMKSVFTLSHLDRFVTILSEDDYVSRQK